MRRFDGKRALVAGTGRGIGTAVARLLSSEGARVAVLDPDRAAAAAAAGSGSGGLGLQCDLLNHEAVQAAVEQVGETFGGIDYAVVCLGPGETWPGPQGPQAGPLTLKIGYSVIHAWSKWAEANPGGGLVIIAVPSGEPVADSLVSFGILGMTRTMGLEIGRYRANANGIHPAWVRPLLSEEQLAQASDPKSRLIPVRRVGEAGDVANVATFLLSPEGSFVSGQVIRVCGGGTIGVSST